ncbi:hypothetical protein H2200_003599 [Cladophialophora chaetospira]|uniref:Uncharacterized protein n=1 Tax=Cladophialophora chaetospira TaxID=386627 RepID=A0AA39CK50_9EURO|nr:hypothetical protein H2200_003599 [Cladophialophora chaetospira]
MWRSWSLKLWSLFIITFVECGIIAAIAVLFYLSLKRNGFVAVENTTTEDASGNFSAQGLLWTALPGFLFTLFKIHLQAVITALVNEVPYAEMKRSEGWSIKKSLMLDYRTYPGYYAWFIAFRNKHWLHGASMLLGWVVTIIIIPLSAHLMTPSPTNFASNISVPLISEFNSSRIDSQVDYRPIFDTVSATRLFEGTPPQWTDGVFAFTPIDLTSYSNRPGMVAVESRVDAVSAYVHCTSLLQQGYSVSSTEVDGGLLLTFSGNDRGCTFEIDTSVIGSSQQYLKTGTRNCADIGGRRIVMLAGLYDRTAEYLLSNFSLVSCKTGYVRTTGSLNVSSTTIGPIHPLAFTAENGTDTVLEFEQASEFEQSIHNVRDLNAAPTEFTTGFGSLILAYSHKQHDKESGWLLPDNLISSMEVMFTTTFAITAATLAFPTTEVASSRTAPATVFTTETRLHVVSWIAYVLLVIFAVLVLQSISLVFYLRQHPTTLLEEPKGLLSSANMLYQSKGINELLTKAREDDKYNDNIHAYLDKYYITEEAKGHLEDGKIAIGELTRKEPPKMAFKKRWFGWLKKPKEQTSGNGGEQEQRLIREQERHNGHDLPQNPPAMTHNDKEQTLTSTRDRGVVSRKPVPTRPLP